METKRHAKVISKGRTPVYGSIDQLADAGVVGALGQFYYTLAGGLSILKNIELNAAASFMTQLIGGSYVIVSNATKAAMRQ